MVATVAFLLVVAGAVMFIIAMCLIRHKRYVVLITKMTLESFSVNLVFIFSALTITPFQPASSPQEECAGDSCTELSSTPSPL